MKKLELCPFCGKSNIDIGEPYPEWNDRGPITYGQMLVHKRCVNGSMDLYVKGCKTAEEATEKLLSMWNRRPAENEVLTLAKLTQMDGKPVWIENYVYPENSGYAICKIGVDGPELWQPDGMRYDVWKYISTDCDVYRYNPEKETE